MPHPGSQTDGPIGGPRYHGAEVFCFAQIPDSQNCKHDLVSSIIKLNKSPFILVINSGYLTTFLFPFMALPQLKCGDNVFSTTFSTEVLSIKRIEEEDGLAPFSLALAEFCHLLSEFYHLELKKSKLLLPVFFFNSGQGYFHFLNSCSQIG